MSHYETGFLISPNLSEEEREKLILKMADVVSKKKGKILKEDRWRKRKLAYPIKKLDEAFYVFFHYEGEPEVPSELERLFKQTDTILRYLTVKKEQREDIRKKKKSLQSEDERKVESEEEEIPELTLEKEDFASKKTKEEEK